MQEPAGGQASYLVELGWGSRTVFTPEDFQDYHRLIADTVRRFVESEVMPHVDALEHQDWALERSLLRKAGALGLLGVEIPENYGGLGLDKVSASLVAETMGRGGAFALAYGGHVGIGTQPITFFGTPSQKARYLPILASGQMLAAYALTEADAGSDALAIRSTARLSGDGRWFILNGAKQFITNAGIADVFIVFAKIDGTKFSAFIVEREFPGVSTGPEENKMGIKASSTRTLVFDDARIPVENLLGQAGRGHLIAFNILNVGRHKLAATCVGVMKRALEVTLAHACQRRQFGRRLADFPLIQQKLADMAILTYVAETMVYRTAGGMDRRLFMDGLNADGEAAAGVLAEFALESAVNKVFASEALDKVVDEGLQIHGGYGYIQDYEIERLYRDARIHRIFEGTNEINRLVIATRWFKQLESHAAGQAVGNTSLAEDSLTRIPPALVDEFRLLHAAKRLVDKVGSTVAQRLAFRVGDEQEVAAQVADLVIGVFAMDSVLQRIHKELIRAGSDSWSDVLRHQLDMAKVFTRETFDRLVGGAGRAIAMTMDDATFSRVEADLNPCIQMSRWLPGTQYKRRIASRIVEAGRYQL